MPSPTAISTDSLASGTVPTSLESVGQAVKLYEVLQRGEIPDTKTIQWFTSSFELWIGGGDLTRSFGLNPSYRQAARQAMQAFHLRTAWRHVSPGRPSSRARAEKLAEEITRFNRVVWPRAQELPEPLPAWTMARTAIFFARQIGPLPESPRQLQRICEP